MESKPNEHSAVPHNSTQGASARSLTAQELYANGSELLAINPEHALEFFKQAIAIDPICLDALVDAGRVAGLILARFDEGLAYFESARGIFESREGRLSAEYTNLVLDTGRIYARQGDSDRAYEYFARSQQMKDQLGLDGTPEYAMLMTNLGVCYSGKGESDKAIEYYLRSQQIREALSLQNTEGYAITMMNIGSVYLGKDELDSSLEYFAKSQRTYKQLGLENTADFADLMLNTGIAHDEKTSMDHILEYYDEKGDVDNVRWKANLGQALEFYLKCKEI